MILKPYITILCIIYCFCTHFLSNYTTKIFQLLSNISKICLVCYYGFPYGDTPRRFCPQASAQGKNFFLPARPMRRLSGIILCMELRIKKESCYAGFFLCAMPFSRQSLSPAQRTISFSSHFPMYDAASVYNHSHSADIFHDFLIRL